MTTPVPDFIPGEVLTAAKLDQLGAAVTDNATGNAAASQQVALLAGQVDGLNTGSAVQAAQAKTMADQVAANTAAIQQLTTSNAALQAGQASAAAQTTALTTRVGVLEAAQTPVITPPTPPNAPTITGATAVTTSSITVAALAPVAGPAPNHYAWEIATPSGSGAFVPLAGAGLAVTASGLVAGGSYDFRITAWSATAPGGVSAPYSVSTAPAPPVVTVPGAPTVQATAIAQTSIGLSLVAATTGSPATSFQWLYKPPAILWGAVGHKDQGGPYTAISDAQQATDLRAMFGATGTVLYRCVGDSSTPAQIGTAVTNLHAVGLEPVITCIPFPPWASFADQNAAYNYMNTAVAAIVATTPTAKYYEIGNEWTIDATVGTHLSDGSLPAHWSGQPYFARMVGATAGAVAAIRAGNPTAKILGGALSGWTLLGLAPAMAASLTNYTGSTAWQWDTVHKGGPVALSNNNQTATEGATPSPNGDIAYANKSIPAGSLIYWEVTVSGSAMANAGAGIGNTVSTVAAGDWLGSTADAIGWFGNGSVSNNNGVVATWATYPTGSTIGFALDRVHNKLWGRVGAAGNWNNDVLANQNPATNTGGFTIPSAVYANPVVPGAQVSHTGDAVVAKFLGAQWIGTPPAGFSQPFVPPASDLTWDYTVLHWYNDVVGGNQMGLPSSFNGGMNAYTLLKAAGRPIFFSEFGSSNGNVSGNNAACGTNLAALMTNFAAHQAVTATEPGVVAALVYEMYQQPNIPQTDYFLYTYTSGATGAIAAQGTAVGSYITAHPSTYLNGPISTGLTATVTNLTPSTLYSFAAYGINSAGNGATSAAYVTSTASGNATSADGTKVPPAAQIIMADQTVVTLVGGQVAFGGTPDPLTANVVLIGVFNGGILYQENNAGGWWYLDRTQGYPWVGTTDPTVSVTPPPPVSNPNVTVNLAALTGKTMNKNIWGFASGMDLHDGCTQFLSNGNPFMATAAKLRPTYLRFNANEDPLRRYGQGQTTIFDLLFSNLSQWADPAIRFCLGVGPTSSGDTGVSAAQWGAWTTSLLTHFQAIGQLSKFDLEVGNETNDIDMAYYGAVYNAISDAAFAISPLVLVGGTCADWWGHMSVSTWLSTSAAKIARNGFFSFHSYRTNAATADADLYAIALGFGDVAAIRGSLAGSAAAHVGVRNNEYGIDGDFTNPDQREAKIQGAIYDDIMLTHCFQTDESAVGFSGGGRWDLVQDGYYGAIGNQLFGVNMSTITPQGWHKGISGQLMRGTEVVVSTTLPNVQVVAVKNAAGMALKLTNYGFVNQSATVGVSGGTLGNVSMKQLTQATSNTAGPPSVTLASLTGVVLPAQSITWITG